MLDFFRQFVSGDYAPHGYCLLWKPELIWTHVISDALIAAAYFSIPIALITFVRKRPDVEFGKMFWLFALFILSCGMTHVMGIWNLWNGDYGAEALAKAVTAAASVPTALLLWPLLPKVLAIPSPSQLQLKNDELALALAERDRVLDQLRAEVQHRERAESALVQSKKIEAVGQLTGGIAHDFNNLLQAIAGNLELIGRSPDNQEKVQRWAANATSAVERGTKLTSQLLTFSRQQRLQATTIALDELLDGMRELLRHSVGPTVRLELTVPEGLCPVAADRTQLELAVLNLAINARDAMPDGGDLSISAALHHGPDDVTQVALTVRDTGIGMAPDVLDRATEPFFTTKGPGKGTGLGLSMVYGVARQAHGDLLIDSKVGRGTSITMLLPCSDGEVTPTERAEAPLPIGADKGISILLVDDDAEVRSTLTDLLAGDGHRCREVAGGEEALEWLRRERFDLLLLDFAMPGMNGAELAAEALELRPDLKMLFITGFADSEAIDRAVDGRAKVLKKPVSSAQLAAAIREMLG
jgi:signal transduction histidine kinase/CheY-like chemotaxis protein